MDDPPCSLAVTEKLPPEQTHYVSILHFVFVSRLTEADDLQHRLRCPVNHDMFRVKVPVYDVFRVHPLDTLLISCLDPLHNVERSSAHSKKLSHEELCDIFWDFALGKA